MPWKESSFPTSRKPRNSSKAFWRSGNERFSSCRRSSRQSFSETGYERAFPDSRGGAERIGGVDQRGKVCHRPGQGISKPRARRVRGGHGNAEGIAALPHLHRGG